MSWSLSKRATGKEIAAEIDGVFHRNAEQGHHNEHSRAILESHLTVARTFATRHTHDEITVSSYGHFSDDGCGNATLSCSVEAFNVASKAVAPVEADPDAPIEPMAYEYAHLTDQHSPTVEHGVTTPITPSEPVADEPQTEAEAAAFAEVGAGSTGSESATTPTDSEGAES